MTLMDAQQYDDTRDRRRRNLIIIGVFVVLILAWLTYHLRNYPERHAAAKFFSALQHRDIEGAYALWMKDPDWKQHPEKYSKYPLGQFTVDWGPSSEYGAITSHRIDCALEPPKKDFASPTGVVVVVIINNRAEPRSMWVEKKSKTISDSPVSVACHGAQ